MAVRAKKEVAAASMVPPNYYLLYSCSLFKSCDDVLILELLIIALRVPHFFLLRPTMRPSARCLTSLHHLPSRPKSTSFIGLGRMGHEMAYNLFSKQYAKDTDAHFVVCDAIPDSARAFSANFLNHFPGAKIAIATTPEE